MSAGTTLTLDNGDFQNSSNAALSTDEDGDGVEDADLQMNGANVRITWTAESGDNSATIGKWSGPDA